MTQASYEAVGMRLRAELAALRPEDLEGLTRDLLRYNRVRLRELEDKKQKAHDYAR